MPLPFLLGLGAMLGGGGYFLSQDMENQERKRNRYKDVQASRKRLQGLLGSPSQQYQGQMHGPSLPGQSAPDFVMQPKIQGTGNGLLGQLPPDQAQAAAVYGEMLNQPQLAQQGAQGLMQFLPSYKTQPKPTTAYQNLVAAGFIPGTPEFNKAMTDYMLKPSAVVNNFPKAPSGFMYKDATNPGKGMERIPGSEFTQAQAKAAGFADRTTKASEIMSRVKNSGFDPASTIENFRADIPLVGNYTASSEFQQYRQAQEDWVRAKLRLESGAVIGDEEMEREITTYFPIKGDGPEVVAQKKKARETAEQNLIKESQGAYQSLYGNKPKKNKTKKYNPATGKIE